VDLKIPEGSIFGILGPNGAGKTTMLRTLLGIIDPDAGTRTLLGADRPISQSRNVGYLPEERGLYQSMRAVDTIAFMGALRAIMKVNVHQGTQHPHSGRFCTARSRTLCPA
jgi:ABC-2 type transport system ATP-binding protein